MKSWGEEQRLGIYPFCIKLIATNILILHLQLCICILLLLYSCMTIWCRKLVNSRYVQSGHNWIIQGKGEYNSIQSWRAGPQREPEQEPETGPFQKLPEPVKTLKNCFQEPGARPFKRQLEQEPVREIYKKGSQVLFLEGAGSW